LAAGATMSFPVPNDLIQHFEKIYIDPASLNSEVAQRVLKYFPEEKVEVLEGPGSAEFQQVLQRQGHLSAREFDESKRRALITPFKGQFFRRCPGATQKKTLNCCNYYVLNLGSQCNMNCSYCYLQSYLNTPLMKIYSNIDQAILELESLANDFPDHPYRVGTGEVIDSLSLDELTLYSHKLIEFFAKYPRWILELKTKSNRVQHLLELPHKNNIMVAWSINPPAVIESEEHGTASFEQRLSAAEACAKAGYQISFHIDPMIYHDEWQKNYSFLVDEIVRRFTPEQVTVMSVGALRFQPEQRHMMRERFGMKSQVMKAEMFQGEGAKLRYDSDLRQQMFDLVIKRFKANSKSWNIFMCMETPESWLNVLEATPMKIDGLKEFFRPLPKYEKQGPVSSENHS
jgi:spore photoproduct lyase